MAEKSSFFDSIKRDRVYYAADFASHMAEYFTNGIFNNGLKVVSNNDMSISIQLGSANINGYKYKLDTKPKVIEVANADGILNRIDNIVIRLDIPNRQITAEIIKGDFAENAIAPVLSRGASVYDLRIAKINIPAGTTAITTDLIEDTRFNSSDCGNVICAVQTPNFTDVLDQYTALWNKLIEIETRDFEIWFQEIKNQLSTDAAGNLQTQLNNIKQMLKISELEELEKINNSDILLIFDVTNNQNKKVKVENLLHYLVPTNGGAHNSIYRGKDITNLFYDGTLSKQIEAGTFDDIFIGDYIIGKTSGRKYLVADINYRLYMGDASCTKPHVLMIPERTMGAAQMNETKVTTGAYISSAMYTTNLAKYKSIIKNDFEEAHILKHRNYLQNIVTSENDNLGNWYDSDIELMNETMIYGRNILKNNSNNSHNMPDNNTIDNSQLSLFRLRHDSIVAFDDSGYRDWYWLRDVVSSTKFALVGFTGNAIDGIASDVGGVRPAFLIV